MKTRAWLCLALLTPLNVLAATHPFTVHDLVQLHRLARVEHQIPLAAESLTLINKAAVLTSDGPFLFCLEGKRFHSLYMINLVQRFQPTVTTHGFRSTFRDWVSEETSHSPEVVEMALAHAIKNKVEAAYRRGKLIEKRKLLMRDWASYCYSKLNAITT